MDEADKAENAGEPSEGEGKGKANDIKSAIEEVSARPRKVLCKQCRGRSQMPDGKRCGLCRGSGIEQSAKGFAGGIDRVDVKK